MEDKKVCTNQGCRLKFSSNENNETACKYHDGKPIFHDIKKGWTCCNVCVYDWEEFLKIPGCKTGPHSTEKVTETNFFKSQTVNNAEKGIASDTVQQTAPVRDIKSYEDEQKRLENEKKKIESEKPKEILKTNDGKYYCGNPGCSTKTFLPDNNNEGDCQHHTGQPVFHDRKKFWACCRQEAYDWDDFMKLPPCAVGKHVPKYKN